MKIPRRLPLLEGMRKEGNLNEGFDPKRGDVRKDVLLDHPQHGSTEVFAYVRGDNGEIEIESAGVEGDLPLTVEDLKDAGEYDWILAETRKKLLAADANEGKKGKKEGDIVNIDWDGPSRVKVIEVIPNGRVDGKTYKKTYHVRRVEKDGTLIPGEDNQIVLPDEYFNNAIYEGSGWLYLNKAGDGPSKDGYADAGEFGKEEAERLAKKFGGKAVTSYGGFKKGTGKESEKWIVKYKRK